MQRPDDREPIRPEPVRHFGLDPVGQAMSRDRENHLDQERRIRLLERQIAQLQRIIFRDPTIRAPRYSDTVPDGPDQSGGDFPFGSAGPDAEASDENGGDQ